MNYLGYIVVNEDGGWKFILSSMQAIIATLAILISKTGYYII